MSLSIGIIFFQGEILLHRVLGVHAREVASQLRKVCKEVNFHFYLAYSQSRISDNSRYPTFTTLTQITTRPDGGTRLGNLRYDEANLIQIDPIFREHEKAEMDFDASGTPFNLYRWTIGIIVRSSRDLVPFHLCAENVTDRKRL